MQRKKYKSGCLEDNLSDLFEEHGFEFYNFTDPDNFGGNDQEFINGTHGSEKSYLRIIIDIAEQNATVRERVNIDHLKRELSSAKDRVEVFGNKE